MIVNGNSVITETQLNSPTAEFFNRFGKQFLSVPKLSIPNEIILPGTTGAIIGMQNE